MKVFFENDLQIPPNFHQLSLEEFFGKISHLQNKSQVTPGKFDVYHTVMRIMRLENYHIAFFNKFSHLFPSSVDFHSHLVPLSKTLEWLIVFVLTGFLTDSRGRIRKKFTKSFYASSLATELNARFKFVAICSAILVPFVFLYQLVYFLLKYGEEIYNSPSQASNRTFSPIAKWMMREYNELDCQFNSRLQKATVPAYKFIHSHCDLKQVVIGKLFAFISGSLLLLLSIASIFNMKNQKNDYFYWAFAVLAGILAVSKSMSISCESEEDSIAPLGLLKQIYSNTHCLVPNWNILGKIDETRKAFQGIFPLKLGQLVVELLGIISSPFVLLKIGNAHSSEIVAFLMKSTVNVDHVGLVCKYSLMQHSEPPDHVNIKSEKSFINFKLNYPSWNLSPSTNQTNMLERLKSFELAKHEFPSLLIASKYPQSQLTENDSEEMNYKFGQMLRQFYDVNLIMDRKI